MSKFPYGAAGIAFPRCNKRGQIATRSGMRPRGFDTNTLPLRSCLPRHEPWGRQEKALTGVEDGRDPGRGQGQDRRSPVHPTRAGTGLCQVVTCNICRSSPVVVTHMGRRLHLR
jgi:hypothetical protein